MGDPRPTLHPVPELDQLAEELSTIAAKLRARGAVGYADVPHAALGTMLNLPRLNAGVGQSHLITTRADKAKLARQAYELRRKRNAIFGSNDLFGEPAWDILLDLYIAQADDKTVSVSSACIGSAAPQTTALRWLGILTEQGLILREHDPEDQRRVFVRLSAKGLAAMDRYFETAGGTL